MGQISKQERAGLEDLFNAIEHYRYPSRSKQMYKFWMLTYKQHRLFIQKVTQLFKK